MFASAAQAQEAVIDLTRGQLADHALITIGVLNSEVVDQAAAMYSLDDINAGYQDLDDGKIIRGVITHAQ